MHKERIPDGDLLIHRTEEDKQFWVERNWSWLVIALGLVFLACIDSWAPTW